MSKSDPFTSSERRPHTEGLLHAEEVRLANRNSGMLLEALRHDVTPAGLHYLLNHFDVPYVAGRHVAASRSAAGSASPLRCRSTRSAACRHARCASRWNAPATAAATMTPR